MTPIRFEPSGYESSIKPGTRLVDLTDLEPQAKIPYSCRSASCGTCRVSVCKGEEAFAPPEEDELYILDLLAFPEGSRLACQLQCIANTQQIILEVIED